MLALILLSYIQNGTWAIIRSFGQSGSDVADDMIPQLFRSYHFQIASYNSVCSSPCMDAYMHPPSGRAVKVKQCGTGRPIPNSCLNLRFWLLSARSEPLSFFLEHRSFLFSPEETFLKLITTGMWIFLSRMGQNKECDHYSLLIKEASLQLLFKRQSNPSWHWVTL